MKTSPSAARELERADRHDAAGNHDEAVNALARATKLGDVEATTRLAKRLLVGDRAPALPADGVSLLVEAHEKGGAEAAARLAVLAALGAFIAPDIEGAIALLGHAAERGWTPAQRQLRLLSDGRGPATVAGSDAKDWRGLARDIDVRFWLTPPTSHSLSDSPSVRAFERFLPQPICDWLIERSRDRLERALVYDAVGGRDIADHTRTNTVAKFDLAGTELVHALMQIRMAASCGLPLHNMEGPAVLHYGVGEEITNHFDFVNPKIPNYEQEIAKNGQRVVTFLVYLNDGYESGETEFVELGLTHKGVAGAALCFVNALAGGAPDLRTVHAGRPPTRGEKWIVSQFGRDRRVLNAPPTSPRRATRP